MIGTGNVVTGSHSYAMPGTYIVGLTVTDDDGDSQTKTCIVDVLYAGRPGDLDPTFGCGGKVVIDLGNTLIQRQAP